MRTRQPFASMMQATLVGLMLLSFLLIAQQRSQALYHVGLVLLVVSTLMQIAFGNIPPSASFGRSMKLLALILAIIAMVFGLGIVLAPYLIQLGRG